MIINNATLVYGVFKVVKNRRDELCGIYAMDYVDEYNLKERFAQEQGYASYADLVKQNPRTKYVAHLLRHTNNGLATYVF